MVSGGLLATITRIPFIGAFTSFYYVGYLFYLGYKLSENTKEAKCVEKTLSQYKSNGEAELLSKEQEAEKVVLESRRQVLKIERQEFEVRLNLYLLLAALTGCSLVSVISGNLIAALVCSLAINAIYLLDPLLESVFKHEAAKHKHKKDIEDKSGDEDDKELKRVYESNLIYSFSTVSATVGVGLCFVPPMAIVAKVILVLSSLGFVYGTWVRYKPQIKNFFSYKTEKDDPIKQMEVDLNEQKCRLKNFCEETIKRIVGVAENINPKCNTSYSVKAKANGLLMKRIEEYFDKGGNNFLDKESLAFFVSSFQNLLIKNVRSNIFDDKYKKNQFIFAQVMERVRDELMNRKNYKLLAYMEGRGEKFAEKYHNHEYRKKWMAVRDNYRARANFACDQFANYILCCMYCYDKDDKEFLQCAKNLQKCEDALRDMDFKLKAEGELARIKAEEAAKKYESPEEKAEYRESKYGKYFEEAGVPVGVQHKICREDELFLVFLQHVLNYENHQKLKGVELPPPKSARQIIETVGNYFLRFIYGAWNFITGDNKQTDILNPSDARSSSFHFTVNAIKKLAKLTVKLNKTKQSLNSDGQKNNPNNSLPRRERNIQETSPNEKSSWILILKEIAQKLTSLSVVRSDTSKKVEKIELPYANTSFFKGGELADGNKKIECSN